ncbi:MAG: CpXC domain-containing protein, partial [Desulfobacteraceae bacterium]
SINGTADPDLRERLLKKELNFAQCEVCGDHGFLTAPLVYYDTERRFCVQLCAVLHDDEVDEELLALLSDEGIMDDETFQELRKEGYLFEPHLVLDPEELIRYIHFREQLYELKKPGYRDTAQLWHPSMEKVTLSKREV